MKCVVIIVICSLIQLFCVAQDSTHVSTLQLHEGIYFNHKQLFKNKPSSFTHFLLPEGVNPRAYLCDANSSSALSYFDEYGILQNIELEQIWGFCADGAVYINIGGSFSQIQIFGSLCYFIANVTVRYEVPTTSISSMSYGYAPMHTQTAVEMRQYIFDIKTGYYAEASANSMLGVLQSDSTLYQQYNALSNGQKNKQLLVYLRKFNQSHPLKIE